VYRINFEALDKADTAPLAYVRRIAVCSANDDPTIFTRPWSQTFEMKLYPTWSLLEQVCEENNRCQGGICTASESQKNK
jgi:hypothetical protein